MSKSETANISSSGSWASAIFACATGARNLRRQLSPVLGIYVAIIVSAIVSPCAAETVRIAGDKGGTILDYANRYHRARDSGQDFVIDGACLSACTMVIGMLPRGRVCVTPQAVLGFHAAFRKTENGALVASVDATKFMMNSYPPAVRKWIRDRGGLTERMMYLAGEDLVSFVPLCATTAASEAARPADLVSAIRALLP
jgi:hypothetical protein